MDTDEVPAAFVCPISLQIMRQPVVTPHGSTYDYDWLAPWRAVTRAPPTHPAIPPHCTRGGSSRDGCARVAGRSGIAGTR